MDISIKRHCGTVTNTGARIYLVYRKVPDDETNCLVVLADALPDFYAQSLHNLVNSRDAQESVDLADVLHRHQFGNGENVLLALHDKRFITKVPVSNVMMDVVPGRKTPLSEINAEIDGSNTGAVVAAPEVVMSATAPEKSDSDKAIDMAIEAEELEKKAKELRKQAIALDPHIKRGARGRPALKLSEDEKKSKKNERRRKAYATKKVTK
jgi:hypothetical protein